MELIGVAKMSGSLVAKRVKTHRKAPISWKLKNALRWSYVWGAISTWLAKGVSILTGVTVMTGELRAVLIKANGTTIDFGVVSRRVITTAWVNFVVDQLQAETSVFGDFKYHDSGVGTTAENVADTAIETTDGEARATGTQEEGASANIYKSVATINYSTTKAITEHGLFNDPTAGTLMDRSVFAAINVTGGSDGIQFTYQLTCTAGG